MRVPKQQEPLSDYPSEAILQALEDLEWVEKTSGFGVKMEDWIDVAKDGSTCEVCQAGAVMIRRYAKIKKFGTGIHSPRYVMGENPFGYDVVTSNQVRSFDYLREGQILSFLVEWIDEGEYAKHIEIFEDIFDELYLNWVYYEESPTKYKAQLRKVAKILSEEGY